MTRKFPVLSVFVSLGNWDKIRRGFFWILILVVILSGFWVAHWRIERADQQIRQHLLRQTTAIAANLSASQLQTLSFTAEDQHHPYFQLLHRQMQSYTRTFGYRSVYTMIQRRDKIIFGPESIDVADPLASPPGTVYQKPPPAILKLFQKDQSMTVGPYRDEYGSFISAYAPVLKPRSNEVFLVVAMDLEVSQWQGYLHPLLWLPLGFTGMLVALLLGETGSCARAQIC